MTAYIIRRLLLMIPTLVFVTLIIFLSVRFIPGNVIDLMVAEMASEMTTDEMDKAADEIRHELGMDQPVYIQYFRWLGVAPNSEGKFYGVIEGNLGTSLWNKTPVSDEISRAYPVSLELGILGILVAVLVSIPIGVYSAIRQDSLRDYAGRSFAIILLSVPSFWLGTMVIVYPSIWWGWTPPMQLIPLAQNPIGNIAQFLLPAFIMGMHSAGSQMRMTRTMMLEVLRQDYIRTAWAKGLRERTIIYRHVLKNALIPVVTILGTQLPILISGTVVIENIFALPGVGRLLIDALDKRDYPIISGVLLVVSVIMVGANLAIDLIYGWLDPRVSYK